MPTPSTRTPVRIARGSYSNLNSSLSDLQEGEIVYAQDEDTLYVKEGSSLIQLTTALLDEDNFATNSATKAASQQSVKAYVDTADALKVNLTGGTFTGSVTFEDAINENVYNCTGTALDPDNGTVQYKALGANTTLTESLTAGQSMLLMVDDGSAYTITWPTMTWVGGSAPTLATSGYSCIELWKIASTLYGCHVGDVA
jgi:hypothetical protein